MRELTPYNYVETLTEKYPNIEVECNGDGTDYDSLRLISGPALPSKAQLDIDKEFLTRVRVWQAIKAERDFRKASGVYAAGHWFHSDDSSRIQQIALVIFGAALPPVQWKCLDGAFATMTPTLAQQIFQASAASDIAIFTAAEVHKAMMMASADPINYDFTGGWPPKYEGNPLL